MSTRGYIVNCWPSEESVILVINGLVKAASLFARL